MLAEEVEERSAVDLVPSRCSGTDRVQDLLPRLQVEGLAAEQHPGSHRPRGVAAQRCAQGSECEAMVLRFHQNACVRKRAQEAIERVWIGSSGAREVVARTRGVRQTVRNAEFGGGKNCAGIGKRRICHVEHLHVWRGGFRSYWRRGVARLFRLYANWVVSPLAQTYILSI